MLNFGVYEILAAARGGATAAFLVAAGNGLLAVLILVAGNAIRPGPEQQMVREIREMALAELASDAGKIQGEFAELGADVQRIRDGFASFTRRWRRDLCEPESVDQPADRGAQTSQGMSDRSPGTSARGLSARPFSLHRPQLRPPLAIRPLPRFFVPRTSRFHPRIAASDTALNACLNHRKPNHQEEPQDQRYDEEAEPAEDSHHPADLGRPFGCEGHCISSSSIPEGKDGTHRIGAETMTDVAKFDMPLGQAMLTQRAIRRVKPDPIDDKLVLELIELAMKGPTQQNTQSWEFIIVKDPAVKAALGRQNRFMWKLYRRVAAWKARNDPKEQRMNEAVEWAVDHFEEIPVLVVACFRGSRFAFPPVIGTSIYGSILPAVQNLLLAARAVGLGANIKHHAALEQLQGASHSRITLERHPLRHHPPRLAARTLWNDDPQAHG